eukprot:8982661-Pyramimonas_sp.AAC.1
MAIPLLWRLVADIRLSIKDSDRIREPGLLIKERDFRYIRSQNPNQNLTQKGTHKMKWKPKGT